MHSNPRPAHGEQRGRDPSQRDFLVRHVSQATAMRRRLDAGACEVACSGSPDDAMISGVVSGDRGYGGRRCRRGNTGWFLVIRGYVGSGSRVEIWIWRIEICYLTPYGGVCGYLEFMMIIS